MTDLSQWQFGRFLSDEEMLSNILKFLEIGWDGPRPFLVNFGYMTPKHVLGIISFFVETFWDASFFPKMLAKDPRWFQDEEILLGEKAARLRPTLALTLAALDRLPLIINRYTELDKATLDTIGAAALRGKKESYFPYREISFNSLEEAALAGSGIARAMIIINVLRQEHQRNKEIEQAEKQLAQSEQRIAELKGQPS